MRRVSSPLVPSQVRFVPAGRGFWLLTALALGTTVPACDQGSTPGPQGAPFQDLNGDFLADELGVMLDLDGDGQADQIDLNGDGLLDGYAVDTDGNSVPDAVALDLNGDGYFEAVDTDGDGQPDGQVVAPIGGGSGGAATGSGGSDAGTGGTPVTGPPGPLEVPTGMQGYLSGYMSDQALQAAYDAWYDKHVESCSGGQMRVKRDAEDGSDTVSEGIGYGMLMAVAFDDRSLFDGLNAYFKANSEGGLMKWKISGCSGAQDSNNATDADLDVAMALLQAACKWGGSYEADALALLGALRTLAVQTSNGWNLKAGKVGFDDANCVNPSYTSPAYYRVFARVDADGAATWNNLANDSYKLLNASANGSTGLVPDWTSSCNRNQPNYTYDAARTPWRVATDYLWHGTPEAKTFADRMTDWVTTVTDGSRTGINAIVDGYSTSGGKLGKYYNSAFIGAFAAAALTHSQERSDEFAQRFYNQRDGAYYQRSLRVLYMLTAAGRFDEASCY